MKTRWHMGVVVLLVVLANISCDEQGEDYPGHEGTDVIALQNESEIEGCHLFGQDLDSTYLGEWGSCYGSDSICSKYGKFGSQYATNGIFNEYSKFGSDFGSYSAWNDFCTKPPLMVCDGKVVGCVTVNSFASCTGTKYHPGALCNCP